MTHPTDEDRAAAGPWMQVVEPLVTRFEVAAAFNADAVHNGKGAAAIAKLMRAMAEKLDNALTVELAAAEARGERRGIERAAVIMDARAKLYHDKAAKRDYAAPDCMNAWEGSRLCAEASEWGAAAIRNLAPE